MTKPGQLTSEYLAGRRAPYVNPISFYFWIQAICFLGFSLTYPKQAAEGEIRAKVILIATLAMAIVLAILHATKRRKFAESFVFSLHFNAFLLLALTFIYPVVPLIVTFLSRINLIHPVTDVGPITTKLAVCVAVPYMIVAMKRYYGEHVAITLAKVVALYFAYFYFYALISKLLHR